MDLLPLILFYCRIYIYIKSAEAADGGDDSGPLTLRTGPITASHLQSAAGFCPGSLREVSAAQKEVMLEVPTPQCIFIFLLLQETSIYPLIFFIFFFREQFFYLFVCFPFAPGWNSDSAFDDMI